MRTESTVDVLNRLMTIECRSLPNYLSDASPWTHKGDEKATETVRHLVADQGEMAQRIAELIDERGGRIETGSFPMWFTDTNLLSLDFLIREMIACQRQDVAAVEQCVADLGADREARELAEEVLGSERAHLEMLEDLVRQPA